MVNLEDKQRVYDEVPAGLIDLPSAARKYGVTRNSLHKRLQTGSLRAHGHLNGGVRGSGITLLSESELAWVAESIVSNRHRRGGIPWNIPTHLDTGCEFSPSCLDCPLPKCKEDMTIGEQMKLRRDLLPMKHLRRQEQGRLVRDQKEASK